MTRAADGPARLLARPGGDVRPALRAGSTTLSGGGLLYTPAAAAAGEPSPLVVLFHGAGSSAHTGLALLLDHAERAGIVLLAPQARASTWDVIHGGFGPDVEQLDRALAHVFATCPVAPDRIALGGFSDGASYALSLGLGNGDLVTHLVAFSPGFVAPAAQLGRPRIFVTHGTRDAVLPIDRCSRRLVPALQRSGYEVAYEEFDGGHLVDPACALRAIAWFSPRTG